ncbi:MAG TPA: isoleucine--tRNA ligase, partial [Patescibacteria group bacterium]|nr:isoleucine--tRNA ligase [Patescibacteria group bacterium]
MYKPLPEKLSYPALESDVLGFWDRENVFKKSLEMREGAPYFSFYDGPATVNGKPGAHHMIARTLKDLVCRYKTMRGYYVPRLAGWDTHGLPVELAVEKQLGLTQKKEIEKIGVEKFNAACREMVYTNIENAEGWRTFTRRHGQWIDLDNAYITCTNDYIESVWWALKSFFDKGLIYKGFKVVPQSPTIETPLSSAELSLNYKDVRDPSVFLKLKITDTPLKDLEGASLLVWTTTPWTLFANVALAVGAEIEYALVRHKREGADDFENLVLATSRLEILDGEHEVLKTFKGAELLKTRYEQIFPYAEIDTQKFPNALSVITGEFVSDVDGTGIVHMAPAFGADDYEMSKVHNLPVLKTVTPNGHLAEDMGEFGGRAIKNFTYNDGSKEEGADRDIVKALKIAGKIYKASFDYMHSYPHCWRTDNPVMYYARDSWFIKSPNYKNELIELNKTINWQPPEIGAGRFGNWLEDVKEWSLSRDRYWGTPLPIWVSEDGKDMFAVGSVAELMEGIYERDGKRVPLKDAGVELDLHRPFVDYIVFEKDGKTYRRTPEVIDVWFDSGSMPFAQMHYPFENGELFEKMFPADFIAEGIDQTRGWFYTLHNIGTALFEKPAFSNVIVNDMILDKKGLKMSKSKGNTVDPFEIMDKYGADAVRWYLLTNNVPWKPTLFNEEDIAKTVIADFFRSLTNTYAFFALYANIDEFTGTEAEIPLKERPEIDRWIISKMNT